MSITYPVFLPVSIKSDRFGLNINKSQFSGEFTRNRITQSHGAGTADRWEGVYTTPPLGPDQHREMSALLNSMSVDDGTFFAFNPNGRAVIGNHDGQNLLGDDAETEQIMTHHYIGPDNIGRRISALGLAVGDVISFSGLVRSTDALGTGLRVAIEFFDDDGVRINGLNNGNFVDLSSTPTLSKIDGLTIPTGTIKLTALGGFNTGSNNRIKQAILTKTGASQTFVSYLKVNGAGQTGTTLNIKDGTISTNGLLRAGTMMQVESQIYEVAKRVDTDGSGNATVEVRPAIRTSHPDGEPILVKNPVMIAQLVETNHPQETNENSIGVISFAWQEKV